MLKVKYNFKASYSDVAVLCAHLKAVQQRAVITPHNRPEGKSLELLLCSILKPVAKRLDGSLYDFSDIVKFHLKQHEALAFHCAYKYGWLPFQLLSQEIFDTLDKMI